MSRIGRQPIKMKEGVSIKIESRKVEITGPKGSLSLRVPQGISVKFDEQSKTVIVERKSESKKNKSFHGLIRTLISNMVEGVTNGYEKILEMEGIGYRVALRGNTLVLSIGYSHPVEVQAPDGIQFELDGETVIKVKGIDKQKVGEVAAKIRALRKPEPYKGKGIRYKGEQIRRKPGKAAVSSEGS